MLSLSDDLDRTFKAFDSYCLRQKDDEKVKPLRDGLAMMRTNLDKSFASQDIIKIDPLNELFDPNVHEAISVVYRSDLNKNIVTSVEQPGFQLGKRVLRPAKVSVNMHEESTREEKGEEKESLE